jgi:hypothetical protein
MLRTRRSPRMGCLAVRDSRTEHFATGEYVVHDPALGGLEAEDSTSSPKAVEAMAAEYCTPPVQ